ECLRLWAQGHGYRTIAKRTGLSRNMVKRHVAAAKTAGLQRGEFERALDDSVLAAVVGQVRPGGSTRVGALRALCRENEQAIAGWAKETAGTRCHGTTRRKPRSHFEKVEKAVLLPAPTERYDTPKWVDLKVGRDHAVVVEKALYSVPYTLGECTLRVRVDRRLVKFYVKRELVKIHLRQPAGAVLIDASDVPKGVVPLVKRDASTLCAKAASYGASAGRYAERLADGPLPWTRIRHVYRLLGLIDTFGGEAVEEACGRALELDVVDVTRIQRMLEKALSARRHPTPRPRRTATGTLLTFVRPMSAFALEGDHAST
ncbi:MAG: hypothetical protein ACI9MC_003283, partial [Kiritimatiellia bacterium]